MKFLILKITPRLNYIILIFSMACIVNVSCSSKYTKKITHSQSLNSNVFTKTKNFPSDWMGYWEGTLYIYNANGDIKKVPMIAEHALTDTTGVYTWALIYGEDISKGRRDYILKTKDAMKGHYVVDERNNILLDTYLIGNQMISIFDVEGTMITSIYAPEDDKMTFTIIAGKSDSPQQSGGGSYNGEDIPLVHSYPVTAYQKGILTKR